MSKITDLRLCRLFRPPLPRHQLPEMPCPVPLEAGASRGVPARARTAVTTAGRGDAR